MGSCDRLTKFLIEKSLLGVAHFQLLTVDRLIDAERLNGTLAARALLKIG